MPKAIRERMQRFSENCRAGSAASADVAFVLGAKPASVHRMIAYIRAIYPPLYDGQTVLGFAIDPDEADSVISSCPDFADLANEVDLRRTNGSPRWSSTVAKLSQERFNPVQAGITSWSGKPDGAGLFTSDARPDDPSMWEVYMASWLGVYEPPWHTSDLVVQEGARILHIESAREWCELITEFSVESRHGLRPDWVSLAADYDGVDLSLRAVAALDCLSFEYDGATIAPSFWSVQTTVWFRWCFSAKYPLRL